jgi:hypothetical protein
MVLVTTDTSLITANLTANSQGTNTVATTIEEIKVTIVAIEISADTNSAT